MNVVHMLISDLGRDPSSYSLPAVIPMRELRPRLVNIGESSRRAGLAVCSMSSNGKRLDHKHALFGQRSNFERSLALRQ
jgi:hypothetical protein